MACRLIPPGAFGPMVLPVMETPRGAPLVVPRTVIPRSVQAVMVQSATEILSLARFTRTQVRKFSNEVSLIVRSAEPGHTPCRSPG